MIPNDPSQNPTPNDPTDWRSQIDFWFRGNELPRRPRRIRSGIYGRARLASARDLEPLLGRGPEEAGGLRFPGVTLLVEDSADGARMAPLLHRDLRFPASLREKHLLAVGGTGCGKTTRLILPQLAADVADPRRAIIALDAKGGVFYDYLRNLARRHRPQSRVHQVNFRRPHRNTITWNPLGTLSNWADAFRVAHAVCSNVERGVPPKDPFWINSSINLLADILHALVEENPEEASLGRAKFLVDGFPGELARFLHKRKKKYPAIARVLDGADRNPNTSIIADLSMRLLLFGDEGVVACTCGPNKLEVDALIAEGGILVVEVCESDAAELLPLTNVFITQLFTRLMNAAMAEPSGRLPRPVSITLDELGSACGRLPEFESRLATLRSRGVSLIGAVQTLSQLEHLYEGAYGSILGNFNTKVFFGGGLSLEDSRYASQQSGTTTVDSVGMMQSFPVAGAAPQTTLTHTPVSRPLLLPEEIARPELHPLLGSPATVFTPDLPPFQAYFPPAFETPETAWAFAPPANAEEHVEQLFEQTGREELPEPCSEWFNGLRERFRYTPTALSELLEQLRQMRTWHDRLRDRKPSLLEEWHEAERQCDTQDPRAVLAFLHWSLIHRWEKQQRDRGEDAAGR